MIDIELNNILKEADIITSGERGVDYGDAKESFEYISELASMLNRRTISSEEVINVLIAVKLCREAYKHKRDNLVDACGYLRLLSKIKGDED